MARAEKMCRDFSLFPKAEDGLQRAVDQKNARSEMYWRKVFGAFAQIVLKRRVKENPWHVYNTAAMYAYGGDNPRYEPDLEQERESEEYHRSIPASVPFAATPIADCQDDDIPF
jgi:hypothetical protein